MSMLKVLIVEDDRDVLERLACLVIEQDDFELLAAVDNYADGLRELKANDPDILMTDIGLPDGSGIDLIKEIPRNALKAEAMVISGFQDERVVFEALEAGAKSYILKHDQGHAIADAIRVMVNGGAPISPVIARLMLQKFQSRPKESPLKSTQKKGPESGCEGAINPRPEVLTERQIMILKYVSQGFSSKEIAQKLDITYFTVTTHIKNIYGKLQVNSRTEALHEALKMGLL